MTLIFDASASIVRDLRRRQAYVLQRHRYDVFVSLSTIDSAMSDEMQLLQCSRRLGQLTVGCEHYATRLLAANSSVLNAHHSVPHRITCCNWTNQVHLCEHSAVPREILEQIGDWNIDGYQQRNGLFAQSLSLATGARARTRLSPPTKLGLMHLPRDDNLLSAADFRLAQVLWN